MAQEKLYKNGEQNKYEDNTGDKYEKAKAALEKINLEIAAMNMNKRKQLNAHD